jgi:histidine triad (HIT) family protein
MSSDCVFCRIVRGELPATVVFQNDEMMAFRDINPSAPTHILIVPRQHFDSAALINDQTAPLVGRMMQVAAQIARDEKVERSGYRLVTNTGPDSGQVVHHFHLHLLGGRRMRALG